MAYMKYTVLNYIQHAIASIHNLSLRMIREDAINIVYSELCKDKGLSENISQSVSNDFIDLLACDYINIFSDERKKNTLFTVTKAMEKIENQKIWLTLMSNPNPYFRKIILNSQIKALFNFFILNAINIYGKDIKNNETIHFIRGMSGLEKFIIYLPDFRGFLVGGFVWSGADDSVLHHIDNIMYLQKFFQSTSLFFLKEELKLLAHQRRPISKERLEEKAKNILDIFSLLSNINQQKTGIFDELTRSDIEILIERVSFFSDKHIQNIFIDKLYSQLTKDHCDISMQSQICIVHGIINDFALRHSFSKMKDSRGFRYNVELYKDYNRNCNLLESGYLSSDTESCVVQQPEYNLKMLHHQFVDYSENNAVKVKSREFELLLEIQDSLYNSHQDKSFEEKLKIVIAKAVNLVGADSGSFMWYHSADRFLELKAWYGDMWNDVEKLKNSLKEWAGDQIKRNESSSYRAFDEKRSILIQDIDKSEEKCIQWFPISSAITVPIFFHERPLGAINLDGYSHNQFTINNLLILSDLAKDIAPYIYAENFQDNIVKLTNVALSQDKEDKDKLIEICKIITNIFFCSGAAIWLRDDVVRNLYRLEGFHNFKLIPPRTIKDYTCKVDEWIVGKAVTKREIQVVDDIRSSCEVMFKENLLEQGYNSLMIAPIMVPNDSTPIGTVSIYDQSMTSECLLISKPLLDVISKFLGLAILMVKGLRQGEKNLRELTAHELGQAITSINNVTGRLSSNLFDKIDLLPDVFEKRQLKLLYSDLEDYVRDAQNSLSLLVSDRAVSAAKKGRDSADILIDILMEGEEEWIDIRALINNILHGEIRKIRRREIKFKIPLIDKHSKLHFHFQEKAVRRVLSNVIDNAIKYTLSDMPYVHLTVYENYYIRELIVTNYGIKIKYSDWENIFHRNYRTDEAMEIEKEGRGMGLFLARKIARKWGGRVYVKQSEPTPEKPDIYETSIAIVFPNKI